MARCKEPLEYIGTFEDANGKIYDTYNDLVTKTTFSVPIGASMWEALTDVRERFGKSITVLPSSSLIWTKRSHEENGD